MNKTLTIALIAGGLLLLDSPEAAAHKEVRNAYQPTAQYRFETRRTYRMPNWLHRNHSFRKWYKRSHLRRDRSIAWRELFYIYRWERATARKHRRAHRYDHWYNDHYGNHRDRDRNGRGRRGR